MSRTPSAPGLALILAALATLGPFSIDTFLPAMATIGHALDASPIEIQQALSIYLLCYGAMMLWHGALSDAIGRRPVILGATLLFAIASIGCLLAQTLGQLLLFRALQGLCGGAGLIVGRAIIRDTFDGPAAQKLMSQVTMLFSLSPAIAPVIGGWLYGAFGWRSIFAFMALVGFMLFSVCTWRLPETHAREQRSTLAPRALAKNYWHIACNRQFRFLALALSFNFAGFFLYIPAAPVFLIRHLGLGPTDFLWLFGPAVSGIMFGAWLSGHRAGRYSARESIHLAYVLMAIAAAANLANSLFFAPSLPWSVLPLALYTTGMSIAAPSVTLFVLDLFPGARGTASSVQGFVQTLFSAAVAGIVAPLLWFSPLALALGMSGFLAIGYLMFVLAHRRRPGPEAVS